MAEGDLVTSLSEAHPELPAPRFLEGVTALAWIKEGYEFAIPDHINCRAVARRESRLSRCRIILLLILCMTASLIMSLGTTLSLDTPFYSTSCS